MTDKLKKVGYGKYQIITDGAVIGHVEEEVYGWAARRSFPTAAACREALDSGTRCEFIRPTRKAAVRAFFQHV